MIRGIGLALCALLLVIPAAVAEEEPPEEVWVHRSVELVPAEGGTLRWNGRRFGGRLEVKASRDGLVVIEHLGVEDYLAGIEEVPLSWPMDALRAQVVAARTYLAWTVARGRAGAGATHGFDICATDACQVYRGADQLLRPRGGRWAQAVRDTRDEILVYDGRPAQALYSSTSGGHTMAVQDVFSGSPPLPYLQGADSPGEESPFVTWTVELASWKLADVLREARYLVGPDIRRVDVLETSPGGGPWEIRLLTGAGELTVDLVEFRQALNRFGPRRHPADLPGERPDGFRYPQVILSYTFSVDDEVRTPEEFHPDRPLMERVFVIEGRGWGHQVGMSQYGAKALAERGMDHTEILAHYYGGLKPEPGGHLLPDEVAVGLDWGLSRVTVTSSGPVTLVADDQELVTGALGEWTFRAERGLVAVVPPTGFGLPPTLSDLSAVSPVPEGRSVVVRASLSTPSEIRLVAFRGPEVVSTSEWRVYEAGPVIMLWDASVRGGAAPAGPYRLLIEGRAPSGSFAEFTTVIVERP